MALPKWLTAHAKLVYVSRSSKKEMDVVVKRISNSQKTVCIVFAKDGKTEMQVPFDQILSKSNPLKLPDVSAVEDENETFFEAMEGSWFQKTQNLDPKVALGSEKGKFAFQGPTAPPMMEVLSSPERSPEPRKPKKMKESKEGGPKTKAKDESKDKSEKPSKASKSGREKEESGKRKKEKDQEAGKEGKKTKKSKT
ncbi:unnamed protein product [Durusdinium trenchii]|uniref:30S ribosomal protein S12 n=2 Tax=Durusdinium trenchii TaxID=1381693 RepID=A0ABP0SPQ1_9DINO